MGRDLQHRKYQGANGQDETKSHVSARTLPESLLCLVGAGWILD
jgi:hypothetical protein